MSARRTRFYLDKQHAKILGVCAGIADYTGIDTLWVRVGVVVLTLFTFPWLLIAYFVTAWLADAKPRELVELDAEETRFWQGVRTLAASLGARRAFELSRPRSPARRYRGTCHEQQLTARA